MARLKDIGHDFLRGTAGEAAAGTATGIKMLTHATGHAAMGTAGAAGILALLAQWDHSHERDQLRAEYESEIAARLGKDPHKVTVDDLDRAAKLNPTINEALQRSRTRRNLSIAITTTGTVLSFALSTFVVGSLITAGTIVTGGLAAPIIGGIVAFASFMATEKIMDKVGAKALHLDEPPLKAAEHNPQLQSELSLPNQVRLIERMQERRVAVSQEQVLTTFIVANPELAKSIASRYGAPFAALPDNARIAVIDEIGPKINLQQLTSDINTRLVRAQELAFVVQGQNSGVPKLENPQASIIDKLQQSNAQLKAKVAELSHTMSEHAAHMKEKLGFKSSNVTAAVPGQEPAAPEPESNTFRNMVGKPADTAGMSQVEKLAARNQGQQGPAMAAAG